MADLQETLERQTAKVEELRQQAEQAPSVASLQALASIYRSRAETLSSLGEHDRALDDRQAAAGLLTQLVLGAGRVDLLETLVETGEQLRAGLSARGRADEAFDNALAETQIIAAAGQTARSMAQLRKLADERKAALAAEPTPRRLEQVVKALSLLAGTAFQERRLLEALAAESEAIETVEAFRPPQPEFVASLRANRALTRAAMGATAEALAELDQVVADFDALLAERSDALRLGGAIEARARRARLLLQQEKVDEGLRELEAGVALAEKHQRAEDEETAALLRQALRQLAEAARVHGRLDQALAAAERWSGLVEGVTQRGGVGMELVEELLDATFERALLHHLLGRNDLAVDEAGQVAATWSEIARRQPERLDLQHRILVSLELHARALGALGRHEEALRDQTALVEGYQMLLRQGAPPQLVEGLLVALQDRSQTLRSLGRVIEAQQDAAMLQQILRELQGGGRDGEKEPGPGAGPMPGKGPLIV